MSYLPRLDHARKHTHADASDGNALAPASVKIGAQTDVAIGDLVIARQSGDVESVQIYRATSDIFVDAISWRKARGAFGSPAVVALSDRVMQLLGYAWDGAAFQQSVSQHASISATPGAGDTPGQFVWGTTPDGAGTPTWRWRLAHDGHLRPEVTSTADLGLDTRYIRSIYADMLHLGHPISPAQITADTNDYNPTGGNVAYAWRLSTDASRNLTGIAGGVNGAMHLLVNVGSFDLVLVHESASSTAANRFLCPGSANVTVNANDSVDIWYDTTSSRWRVVGL